MRQVDRDENYWTRTRRLSRLRLLAGAGSIAAGAMLAACNSGGNKNNANKAAGTSAPSASTAAATAASAGKAVRGGSLTLGLMNDIANLDPLKSSLVADRQVHYHIYDSLVATDKDLKLQPALALSWETADPMSIVFKMRPGVQFHDGTLCGAEAVKFNIDRILQAASSPRKSEIASVDSVQVSDPGTVKLILKTPTSPLLAQLVDRAGMILSPAAIQKLGDDLTRGPTGAGTGSFKFVEYKKDDHVALTRNETYWRKDATGGALPYLEKLNYRPLPDENQRLNSLKSGEIDFADTIPSKDVEGVKKDSSLIYSVIPALNYGGIDINSSSDVFKDVRVRQALAWSIDRQQIIDTVFFKIRVISNGPIAPPHFAYDPNYKPFTRDIAKAKALLQQAGKTSVSFTLLITANSAVTQQYAELVKDQAKDAGFTINLQALDFPTLNAMSIKGQYEAAISGWSGRLDPDGNTYAQFHTGGGFNYGKYSNPQVDKVLDDARQTFDEAKRKTLYQQANKLIVEDVPYLFTDHNITGQFSTNKVKNYTKVPDQIYRFFDVWKA